jgi:hypothetical protein
VKKTWVSYNDGIDAILRAQSHHKSPGLQHVYSPEEYDPVGPLPKIIGVIIALMAAFALVYLAGGCAV